MPLFRDAPAERDGEPEERQGRDALMFQGDLIFSGSSSRPGPS